MTRKFDWRDWWGRAALVVLGIMAPLLFSAITKMVSLEAIANQALVAVQRVDERLDSGNVTPPEWLIKRLDEVTNELREIRREVARASQHMSTPGPASGGGPKTPKEIE